MASICRVQDMPPAGGYKPICYQRIPAKQYFNGWALIGGYLGITAGAYWLYFISNKMLHREKVEERSANFALLPLLLAERDRAYLKQLRRNRDEEASLMKNVKGWKVGTWFGEPVYHTTPKDTLIEPDYYEYFAHASRKDHNKRAHLPYWS